MVAPNPPCPACGQADKVAKASLIYLEGIRRTHQRSQIVSQEESLPLPPFYHAMDAASIGRLSRLLKPPESGKTQMIRPIHPDLVVLIFSLVVPLFLYEIYNNQTAVFLPALIVGMFFYGVYFWKRRQISKAFIEQQAKQHAAEKRIEKAIQRWMKLWYCPGENIVFAPGEQAGIPADQMTYHLLQDP